VKGDTPDKTKLWTNLAEFIISSNIDFSCRIRAFGVKRAINTGNKIFEKPKNLGIIR
jgi:hypothetical protein